LLKTFYLYLTINMFLSIIMIVVLVDIGKVGMFLAIWRVDMDARDFERYRKELVNRGFVPTSYFSTNGFNTVKMRQLALAGRMDAARCMVGKSIRWYYREDQAELARLRGELH